MKEEGESHTVHPALSTPAGKPTDQHLSNRARNHKQDKEKTELFGHSETFFPWDTETNCKYDSSTCGDCLSNEAPVHTCRVNSCGHVPHLAGGGVIVFPSVTRWRGYACKETRGFIFHTAPWLHNFTTADINHSKLDFH